MFERLRAKRAEKEYQDELDKWQAQHDAYAELLKVAQEFEGLDTNEIMLSHGEALFYKVTNVSLIEERVTGGHFAAGSHGVSVPIGSLGGRSVRYRVGATRGHYGRALPPRPRSTRARCS